MANKRPREEHDAGGDARCIKILIIPQKTTKLMNRVREFQSHWYDGRPWLEYNDDTRTMFC